MPGGNTRTTSFHPPYPIVFERGHGPWLWDVDGRRYVDLFYNGLSIIHGHGYQPITHALSDVATQGTAWSGASRIQTEFAEHLRDRLSMDALVRFANSGSEACMLAVKIARRVTGRPLILKFEHAYHGSYTDLETGLYGRGELPDRVVLAQFSDVASCEAAFERHGSHIAAVIFEPLMFTGRVNHPRGRVPHRC
jgi:glutamate-1-semialdehyde 2,1-aminomutase